jgi:hypothetical protein
MHVLIGSFFFVEVRVDNVLLLCRTICDVKKPRNPSG